jgi:hypothetical protein
VRALARKYRVHWRLVQEAPAHAEPGPRKTPARRSPQLEPLKEIIDGWLRADLDAPRKQRHTVKRIHSRLMGPRRHRTSRWPSPGGRAGRPVGPSSLAGRLQKIGIHPARDRSTALFQLATGLPAAVFARTLGSHVKVAIEWQHAARSHRSEALNRPRGSGGSIL